MFKALRRSALKGLIHSVYPAFFFLNHRAIYSLMGSLVFPRNHPGPGCFTFFMILTLSLWGQRGGYYGYTAGTESSPTCLVSHIQLGPSWARAMPPDSLSDGEPSAVPWAPEGPLPWRAEATPPPWAVFRDSGRVPSVPGVQSSAWRTFSFSASLEVKRGQRPCPPLLSTPEKALSSSHSNSAYRLTTHSHDFQRLLWFRHPGLGNACSGLWYNSAGFFY